MNIAQRVVIVTGVLAVLVAGLYPPWSASIGPYYHRPAIRRSAGWHPIFRPPGQTDDTTFNATFQPEEVWRDQEFRDTLRYDVDISRLLLELLMVGLVTIGLVFVFKSPQSKQGNTL